MIRKVHLDFHTDPETEAIGAAFDPDTFAETLAAAQVTHLATPGKCHFGNIYYQSAIGRSHPQLAHPELFPATVAACAARGIAVQAYWTLGLDAAAALDHPAWRQRYADGSYGCWGHYLHMCFASPYIDEMVLPEIDEAMTRCPGLAGFWFDIALYVDGAFYSEGFERAVKDRLGHGDDNARWQLARELIRERCLQLDLAIKARLPAAENYYNSLVVPGEPANVPLQPVQEVENPIVFGGPEKMTSNVRWLRHRPTTVVGLVSRFQGPWSDPGTLRTADQMRFDVARTAALGAQLSMGDHRRPDGTLEPQVYRQLRPIYGELAELAPLLDAVRPTREALLLSEVRRGSGNIFPDLAPGTGQFARLLEELGLQFDVATVEEKLPLSDLVIWPAATPGSPELLARLRDHVETGGALLATGPAAVGAEDLFGITLLPWPAGDTCGPTEQFVRWQGEADAIAQIMTGPTRLISALPDTEILADRYVPVSTRPPFAADCPAGPMMVQRGRVIYSAASLFDEQLETGTPIPAALLSKAIDRLLPARLVQHDAGESVAAHLHCGPGGYVLHLLHWALDRWPRQVNPVRHFPRLGPISVDVAALAPVTAVRLEPQGRPLPFDVAAGRCRFTVPGLHIWQVIRLESGSPAPLRRG